MSLCLADPQMQPEQADNLIAEIFPEGGAEINRQESTDGDAAAVIETVETETRTCGHCGKETSEYVINRGIYVRCKPCNTFKSKMQRVFQKDESLRDKWNEMTQGDRDQWLQNVEQRLDVKELHKSLMVYVEHSRVSEAQSTAGVKKWYGDDNDLALRYAGKEAQLQAVKANANKVWHDLRQCYLYEDYDLEGSAMTMETETHRESFQAHRKVKPMKKPAGNSLKRPAAPAALTEEDEVDAKRLKVQTQETKKLEKMKARIEKARTDAEGALEQDCKQDVPVGVRKALELKIKQLEVLITDIDLVAKGEHMSMDFEAANKSTVDILKRHTAAMKSFASFLKTINKATDAATE